MPEQAAVSQHVFKRAMRCLAATPTIVTARWDNCRYGMTATAVSAVSANPPSLLVCINRGASICEPVLRAGWFCVNVIDADHQDLCRIFSGGAAGESRFQHGEWNADADGIPHLADAQANLVCQVEQQSAFGTHQIFVARIITGTVREDASPLVYLNGEFLFRATPIQPVFVAA